MAEGGILLAGQACRFPDAPTPAALLANSLEGRRSFRAIPPERLALSDYDRELIGEADSITRVPAGLLTDWRFDTARFRVPRAAFTAADPAHWLALEVAADAIESAGGADSLDPESTAVIVANSLTGEFSRAALLRLRWPWLDRQLGAALAEAGVTEGAATAARREFRARLTDAFPAPDEESLAGGLANTIAGRIANHFDLHGGAWSVDGACASSLVAIANAAELIAGGQVSAILVAAVDLSLDPFELVGFSRNGALAKSAMRVFDRRAEGFWPGEGAGAVLLVEEARARRKGLERGLALAGWGVASDGRGGLTRPDAEGQRRALERAYARAAADPANLGYVEAHGTGTAVGDPTEVRALAAVVGSRCGAPLPIASIKGNIGHTKAAAGLAGLIRTAEAMRAGIVPPHSGCDEPHPVFAETGDRIRVSAAPSEWDSRRRRVAGISSFGFGGINAHVVLAQDRPGRLRPPVPAAPPSRDAELFLFRAGDAADLRAKVTALAKRAPSLSLAELGDAAADAAGRLSQGDFRLALVASSSAQLTERLSQALSVIEGGKEAPAGIHCGRASAPPRLGLLFPGQAAPVRLDGGAWARRFPGRYALDRAAVEAEPGRTHIAQPAIVAASMAGLDLLDRLGIEASGALGHSLGELAALAWGGAIGRDAVVDLARRRGRAMAALEPGAMLRLDCAAGEAEALSHGLPITIACHNAAEETIVSGPFDAIETVEARARRAGREGSRLAVSHAFHSPMMKGAGTTLRRALQGTHLARLERPVVSTVTGRWIGTDEDLAELLVEQPTSPVRFTAAAALLADAVDVLVEVGPGAGLTRLLSGGAVPVMSLDVFGASMIPALDAIASLFVLGCDMTPAPLFEGPGLRPFVSAAPSFLPSPCGTRGEAPAPAPPTATEPEPVALPVEAASAILPTLMAMVADETGLDPSALSPEDRFLDDLHLNSLAVSRLVSRLGRVLGRSPAGFATAFANARLRDVAASFAEAEALADVGEQPSRIEGAGRWIRRFTLGSGDAPDAPASDIIWQRTNLASGDEDGSESADGLAILLGPWDAKKDAAALLLLCRKAVGRFRHLALCHQGAPLSGLARSIAAERLFDSVRLIEGAEGARLDDLLGRHVAGFEELRLDQAGDAVVPKLVLAPIDGGDDALAPKVVMVTGGARGIGAECAIRLAERHGAALILVGRKTTEDRDVAATLARLSALGVAARYVQADVSDAERLRSGVSKAAGDLGAVTHLIHAAGINEPTPLPDLDEERLARTLVPKTDGLVAAIEACGPTLVRAVAFGSIIARLGLKGEAHYALANAEQSRLFEAIAMTRPELSAVSIEWSIWSGAGMGERMGVIDRLTAAGVDSLSLDEALDEFEALALGRSEGSLVVTSRFGVDAPLPEEVRGRFLDRVLVHTPGVELVVETRVGRGRDPYLEDHCIDGVAVVPGVMLMEMMAQVGAALDPSAVGRFSDLRFQAALDIGEGELTIRIAALRETDGSIRCAIRSARDDYAAVCASARLCRGGRRPRREPKPSIHSEADSLYGPLFFQGPAFRKIERLGEATSRTVSARLRSDDRAPWFGGYEDAALRLGDPGRRDAALHLLQCCVPDRRLVPISVRSVDIFGGAPVYVRAIERWSRDEDYCFDILQMDADGRVAERWREAVFRAIGIIDVDPVLKAAPELAAAYVERRARAATGDETLSLAIIDDAVADRDSRRARAATALGLPDPPLRRGDGQPLAKSRGRHVSFSHSGSLTIGISSSLKVGCDVERVAEFAAADLAKAWTAEEVLRKLGSQAAARPLSGADAMFTGDRRERIVSLGPIPGQEAEAVAVAVGAADAGTCP